MYNIHKCEIGFTRVTRDIKMASWYNCGRGCWGWRDKGFNFNPNKADISPAAALMVGKSRRRRSRLGFMPRVFAARECVNTPGPWFTGTISRGFRYSESRILLLLYARTLQADAAYSINLSYNLFVIQGSRMYYISYNIITECKYYTGRSESPASYTKIT